MKPTDRKRKSGPCWLKQQLNTGFWQIETTAMEKSTFQHSGTETHLLNPPWDSKQPQHLGWDRALLGAGTWAAQWCPGNLMRCVLGLLKEEVKRKNLQSSQRSVRKPSAQPERNGCLTNIQDKKKMPQVSELLLLPVLTSWYQTRL